MDGGHQPLVHDIHTISQICCGSFIDPKNFMSRFIRVAGINDTHPISGPDQKYVCTGEHKERHREPVSLRFGNHALEECPEADMDNLRAFMEITDESRDCNEEPDWCKTALILRVTDIFGETEEMLITSNDIHGNFLFTEIDHFELHYQICEGEKMEFNFPFSCKILKV